MAKKRRPVLVTPALLQTSDVGCYSTRRILQYPEDTVFEAYKVSRSDGRSPNHPEARPILICKRGAELVVEDANTQASQDCGRGVNVATFGWCYRSYCSYLNYCTYLRSVGKRPYKCWLVRFTGKDIAAIPNLSGVGKFRLFRGYVVRRVKLDKYEKETNQCGSTNTNKRTTATKRATRRSR